MSEVITIYQLTGPDPTYNETTAIRFCADDLFNAGLQKPCKVPPIGTDQYNSFWITLIMEYSGDFSLINNARFWGPGNIAATWYPGSKGRMVVPRKATGDHGYLVENYQQAAGTSGLTGYGLMDAVHGHAQYKDEGTTVLNVDTLNESSPYVFDSRDIEEAGYSKCMNLQTECYPGAGHGEMTPVTLIIAVDVV
jgi:hypothetical protein